MDIAHGHKPGTGVDKLHELVLVDANVHQFHKLCAIDAVYICCIQVLLDVHQFNGFQGNLLGVGQRVFKFPAEMKFYTETC